MLKQKIESFLSLVILLSFWRRDPAAALRGLASSGFSCSSSSAFSASNTDKFYKLHSFRENDYFDEDALIFPIVRNDIPERSFIIDPVEIETAIKQKKDSEKPERQAIKKKHRPINEPLEIDLHINELLDTTAGMSNSDILQYQLQKVREILNEHKNEKGRKIIFIHGKGDGVLRNALITELKTKYKTFYYQDASFREYGYGATQVTIR